MAFGNAPPISLQSLSELIAQSEIDFRTLKANILAVLEQRSQASIADVLQRFPASQGLGSIVGLLALGSRHGYKIKPDEIKPSDIEHSETVSWLGGDNQQRRARIPKIFFLKERAHELA